MSRVTQFRSLVRQITGGDPHRARPFGQFLNEMGITRRSWSWASARAQLTKAMKSGGPLEDLVQQRLILPDKSNRQPECFKRGDL
jgi:hypothetical protein